MKNAANNKLPNNISSNKRPNSTSKKPDKKAGPKDSTKEKFKNTGSTVQGKTAGKRQAFLSKQSTVDRFL